VAGFGLKGVHPRDAIALACAGGGFVYDLPTILRLGIAGVSVLLTVAIGAVRAAPGAPVRGADRSLGRIAFVRQVMGLPQVFVMSGDGTGAQLVTHGGTQLQFLEPAWSRDGRSLATIAIAGGNPDTAEIVVRAPDGGLHQITHNAWEDSYPSWSPDGRWIAFYSRRPARAGGPGIYITRRDGSGIRPVLRRATETITSTPSWSPDGKTIAFVHGIWTGEEIFTVTVDGRVVTRLTHDHVPDREPAWSPDGKRIALVRTPGKHANVFVMDADGGRLRQVTHAVVDDRHPTWSPDGRRLAFARGDLGERTEIYSATVGEGGARPLPGKPTGGEPSWGS
jgi:TolB protein